MARIAFIGLGNMGGGMAANLVKAGHEVRAFDLSAEALDKAERSGCLPMGSAGEAVEDVEAVVTMLPAGDRKSTRLNSSHLVISYAVFCLKQKETGPWRGRPRHR